MPLRFNPLKSNLMEPSDSRIYPGSKGLNLFLKKTMNLVKSITHSISRNDLSILRLTSILLGILASGTGFGTPIAFSEDKAALEELKKIAVNFHEVAPGLYRSGLIPEKAAPLLKELGIKTVD